MQTSRPHPVPLGPGSLRPGRPLGQSGIRAPSLPRRAARWLLIRGSGGCGKTPAAADSPARSSPHADCRRAGRRQLRPAHGDLTRSAWIGTMATQSPASDPAPRTGEAGRQPASLLANGCHWGRPRPGGCPQAQDSARAPSTWPIRSQLTPLDRPGQGDGSESRFSIGLEPDPFTIACSEAPEATPLRFCRKKPHRNTEVCGAAGKPPCDRWEPARPHLPWFAAEVFEQAPA